MCVGGCAGVRKGTRRAPGNAILGSEFYRRKVPVMARASYVGLGLALGAGLGAALGNVAVGIALGLVFGAGASAIAARRSQDS